MIPFDKMPDDNAELAKLKIDFPFLPDNTAGSCPVSMDEIQDYLRLEDADLDVVEHRNLTFLRTAQVAETKFWIWRYEESDGEECYVTVEQAADGSTTIGMDGNYYELSPEQFMLGTYHNVF